MKVAVLDIESGAEKNGVAFIGNSYDTPIVNPFLFSVSLYVTVPI